MRRAIGAAVGASRLSMVTASAQASREDTTIVAWLQGFDRAFVAKDLNALAARRGPAGGGVLDHSR